MLLTTRKLAPFKSRLTLLIIAALGPRVEHGFGELRCVFPARAVSRGFSVDVNDKEKQRFRHAPAMHILSIILCRMLELSRTQGDRETASQALS